jgi:hypothetical protein
VKVRRRERNPTSQLQSLQWKVGNKKRSTDILHLGGLETTKGQTKPVAPFYAAAAELANGRSDKKNGRVSVWEMLMRGQPPPFDFARGMLFCRVQRTSTGFLVTAPR